jgi:2-keto-4-pentenoate hydratase/2-oxohepta-3-ene-1,7-dioic acid hydratase in catechol pathway
VRATGLLTARPRRVPESGWGLRAIFDPVALVEYVSTIVLNPCDIIATGTPGGVGHARKPPRFLAGLHACRWG